MKWEFVSFKHVFLNCIIKKWVGDAGLIFTFHFQLRAPWAWTSLGQLFTWCLLLTPPLPLCFFITCIFIFFRKIIFLFRANYPCFLLPQVCSFFLPNNGRKRSLSEKLIRFVYCMKNIYFPNVRQSIIWKLLFGKKWN